MTKISKIEELLLEAMEQAIEVKRFEDVKVISDVLVNIAKMYA